MTNFEYIFLYCDHWCERCIYTANCQQFALGTISSKEWREWTQAPEQFWKNIHLSYQASQELLNNILAEKGINLAASAPDVWEYREGEISSLNTKAWPYVGWAKLYGEKVVLWEAKFSQNPDNQELTTMVKDLQVVIRQYQHYLFAKLNRVAQFQEYYASLEEDLESGAEILIEIQKAILAIDRSLGAWNSLLDFQLMDSESISELMVLLLRTRFHLHNNFPEIDEQEFPTFGE